MRLRCRHYNAPAWCSSSGVATSHRQAKAAAVGAAVGAALHSVGSVAHPVCWGRRRRRNESAALDDVRSCVCSLFCGSQLASDDDGGTTRTGQGPGSGMHSTHTDTLLVLPPLLVACIYIIIVGRGQFFCPQSPATAPVLYPLGCVRLCHSCCCSDVTKFLRCCSSF